MPHDPLSEGALYTDFYQLTMAQLYYRMDLHDRPAQFDHFYRTNPSYGRHQAGFTINAGLGTLLEHLRAMRFGAAELDHLRAQTGRGGEPLFGEDFLAWLANEADFSRLQID
ncbi:MAG: nicotinate phosphoribosyltransferase, partial [Anaerolineales bacterium]